MDLYSSFGLRLIRSIGNWLYCGLFSMWRCCNGSVPHPYQEPGGGADVTLRTICGPVSKVGLH